MPIQKLPVQDIRKLPSQTSLETGEEHVAFGDLHGNALKLIHQLVAAGFITNLSEDNYRKLVDIYNKEVDDLTERDLNEFKGIVNTLEFNTSRSLTLIGDELADRGRNDYFTLLVMKKMSEAKLRFDVTVSNHSLEFIRNAEKSSIEQIPNLKGQKRSYMNYEALRKKFPSVVDEGDAIVRDVYKKKVKAVNYTYDINTKKLTLYTHAPVDLAMIKRLCLQFGVPPQFESKEGIMKSLDALNAAFQHRFETDMLHELYDNAYVLSVGLKYKKEDKKIINNVKKYLSEADYSVVALNHGDLNVLDVELTSCVNPLQLLVWNRRKLPDPEAEDASSSVHFVHGHTGPQEAQFSDQHTCIDNDFGKGDYLGAFPVFFTDPCISPALQEQPLAQPVTSEDEALLCERAFLSDYLGEAHPLVQASATMDLQTLQACRKTLFEISRRVTSETWDMVIQQVANSNSRESLESIYNALPAPREIKKISSVALNLALELNKKLKVAGSDPTQISKLMEDITEINRRIEAIQTQMNRLEKKWFVGGDKREKIRKALSNVTYEQIMANPNDATQNNPLFNALKQQRHVIKSLEAKAFTEFKKTNRGDETTCTMC